MVSISDLNTEQLTGLVGLADRFRQARRSGVRLVDFGSTKSMAMLFQKSSLRTRVTFELGMKQMGGITVVLGPDEAKVGVRETATDVGGNLGRMVDIIMARVFDHQVLLDMRDASGVPVVNGL
ncbi:MAG: ornithine carbamoyltransferase, partial [Verrucomicrobia bacterium]|nr:ornithine carbamoyltransferase [Verrucomicrobiota bacterium]